MALFRYLAHAMLVFALASGCSQSLFDDGNGDGPPGPTRPDGGPGTPDDGSMPPMTDGSMAGRPDAGDPDNRDGGAGRPDAAVNPTCPDPCAGDAYAEFDGVQGGRWRYVEILPEDQYGDMTYGLLPDSSSGWRGTGSEPPAIVRCNEGATDTRCAELGGTLAFTSNGPDAHHPALRWTAETERGYLVTVYWHGSSTASSIQTLVTITHDNGAIQTLVDSQSLPLTTTTNKLERDVVVAAGDSIVLGVHSAGDGSVTVGVELFISEF